jgi:hypothetical protein
MLSTSATMRSVLSLSALLLVAAPAFAGDEAVSDINLKLSGFGGLGNAGVNAQEAGAGIAPEQMRAEIVEVIARVARDRRVDLKSDAVLERHRDAAGQAIEPFGTGAGIAQATEPRQLEVDV